MPEPRTWGPFAAHAGLIVVVLGVAEATDHGIAVMQANGWWWPFWIVQAGILAGNLLAVRSRAAADEASRLQRLGRTEDLQDAHATIVTQLRNLETEREKLAPEDYARERALLLETGAAVLRELDLGPTTTGAGPGSGGPPPALLAEVRALRDRDPAAFDAVLAELGVGVGAAERSAAAWRGAGWTLAVVAVVGVLALYANDGSRARGAGETMTGGDQVMAANDGPGGQAPPTDPRVQALLDRVAANPGDVEALNRLTEVAIAGEDLNLAMEMNGKALEAKPTDVDARTFKAVLKAFIGRKDEALGELDALVKEVGADKAAVRPLVYTGLLTLDSEPARAVAALEAASKLDPNPQIARALAQAKQNAAGGGAPTPAPPPPTQPAAPGGDPTEVLAEGTLTLADAGKAGQVLFVFLRDPAGGPPLAAVNLAPGPFPMPFRVTRADLVGMGGVRPLPAAVTLAARLDSDGDPMSKPPTDPSATVEGFQVGTRGATLTLQ